MTKKEFLVELSNSLNKNQIADVQSYVADYSELIDDKVDNGQPVAEAIASLGPIEEIVSQIRKAEGIAARPKVIIERKQMRLSTKILLSILLVLGAPLWGPLLGVALVLLVLVYSLLWIAPFIAAVIGTSFIGAGGFGLIASLVAMIKATFAFGLFQLGMSLVLLGGGIFAIMLAWYLSKYFIIATVSLTKWLIKHFKQQKGVDYLA
ncbi:DUF1700 domain-containing protein [Liquorilactobacillus nagelii]|jgi:uncharacterized membrane protein|uniref:DUF1700 domain-containing protein n=1 Tax=Liquorilactobacillus nagelii TaxID=82688 RepID=UPI0006F161B4|nr:DUF1700 domain-containing protein [Liquorilactobacillus nagelii]KRL41669.1 hypothetical protein FD45_GL000512 [Liquorilactobacillus nagelii DSM 13675]MCI1700805.1 DUF1700 domain-containing protein [Liquorilactobacillus nagelii]QYH55157.1 DUF1700 domain-containing protein [Liquorilactobacillus nagelii DSM 13675]